MAMQEKEGFDSKPPEQHRKAAPLPYFVVRLLILGEPFFSLSNANFYDQAVVFETSLSFLQYKT